MSINFHSVLTLHQRHIENFKFLASYCVRSLKFSDLNLFSFFLSFFLSFLWRCDPTRVMASSLTRFLDHTQRCTTVGGTPLDEWSTSRRDLYLTQHKTHNRQTSMPPVGFEHKISAGERPQTYALDRAATGTGGYEAYTFCIWWLARLEKRLHAHYIRTHLTSRWIIDCFCNLVVILSCAEYGKLVFSISTKVPPDCPHRHVPSTMT
jgi:hypothetical protein